MSSYEIPFKSTKDKTKNFLKTIQEMIYSNDMKKKKKTQYVKKDNKKYIKTKGKMRLVHFGKKGGKYFIKDGKKHYIPKNARLITKSKIYKGGFLDNEVVTSAITVASLFGLAKKLEKDIKQTKKVNKKKKVVKTKKLLK